MTSLRLLPDLDIPTDSPGTGLLTSERGNLPLVAMTVSADITGLVTAMTIRQTFGNPHDCPIEAHYIFPLPDRAAVTDFSVTIGSRRITGVLQERQAAREAYQDALAAGQRAALLEEDRPDVFTTSIGNLAPGEEANVELTLAGTVAWELGEATFRVPLVVAPRYIPGDPLDGANVGQGTALDTDAVPDASRITPPVLLPGSANPVRLSVTVRLDPSGMPVSDLRSSLHAVTVAGEFPGPVTVELRPGERLNRDFILRYATAGDGAGSVTAMAIPDDGDPDVEAGTYIVTVFPPAVKRTAPARDVVLVLDRSGSMGGWKMVAARRAAARIVDSLTSADRFAVLAFDHEVERPSQIRGDSLVEATDRNRFRTVEWLSHLEARGGTEMVAALRAAYGVVAGRDDPERARCCILVTDGQVGDEDRLVRLATNAGVRTFTVGIDQAVNAGLLRRLAGVTGGRCDLVESEDQLDAVLAELQRRIGHPVLESVTVRFDGLAADPSTVTPSRPADLYPGVPLVVRGRYQGRPGGRAIVSGHDGTTMSCEVITGASRAAAAVWARAHLRDLEDLYAVAAGASQSLAAQIVAVSLRHRVLCRFTAWVAVDHSGELVEGWRHEIVQPVEMPAGWAMAACASPPIGAALGTGAAFRAPTGGAPIGGHDGSLHVGGPPPAPYQTAPAPYQAPGTPPTPRMAVPNRKLSGRRSGAARPELEVSPVSLQPYQVRLEALLASVDRSVPPAPEGPAGEPARSSPAGDILTLAAEARLLAGDIASVTGTSALVDLLEALARALAAGDTAVTRVAVEALRDALGDDRSGRSRRAKPFWR